jgi:hypothetical protein
MTEEMRHLGLYGAAGILVAILIIAGIITSSIHFPSLQLPDLFHGEKKGTLIIMLTDAPANITHLNVTINKVAVQKVENYNETWIPLPFVNGTSKVSFDLLTLQDMAENLSVTEISPGKYTKIRLGIEEANVTYAEGGWEPVDVPPGRIDIKIHFEVKGGASTIILVDMYTEWIAISQTAKLRPELKADATVISEG